MAGNDNIAARWKKLSGEDKWEGLLSPLDNDLRHYIIHYGERTGAVRDLFDAEQRKCKSEKENFFSEACLVKGNDFEYSVTDFFYAGSHHVYPAWFGYVAVTTDKGKTALGRRDILVVWRGTIKTSEWINNIRFGLTSAKELFGKATQAKVHTGFLSLYTGSVCNKKSARKQVRDAVRKLVDQYNNQNEEVSITITGFSLGAALATLNAMDIVANGYNKPTGDPSKSFMVTAFPFASPRVGDSGLNQELSIRCNDLRLLRITNSIDPVPRVPRTVLPYYAYVHLGDRELTINTHYSSFLNIKWGRRSPGRCAESEDDNMEDYFDPDTVPYIPDEEGQGTERSERSGRVLPIGLPQLRELFFSAHNMDVYMHGVAGLQNDPENPNLKFSLDPYNGAHDYVLVNKHLNRLLPEYEVPANWWEGENRQKMEQPDNGRWRVKR